MLGDLLFIEPYGPFPVEVLADEDFFLGEASSVFPWRDVDDEAAEAHAVIVSDSSFVGE